MAEKEIKGIKKFFEEFKAFAMRGNVLDMAVGVVVGGAFTAIVTALVDDVSNPLIGLFFKADFSDARPRSPSRLCAARTAPPSWRASRRSMPDPATPVPEKSSCTKRYSCFFAVSVRCGACRRPDATAARHTGSSPPAGPRPTGRKHTPAGGTPQRRGTAPR